VTATPTEFKQGWLPDGFSVEQREGESVYVGHLLGLKSELQLRAACCGRPVHVSGWDMANRRPKPTRRLVAPGSVYFFTKTDGSAFTAEEAEALWMKGQGKSSQEGFGFCLPGIWNVENTEK
jgi:CRISPR-associated protein Cmr3